MSLMVAVAANFPRTVAANYGEHKKIRSLIINRKNPDRMSRQFENAPE
jgi:hypothetical protein